MTNKFLSSGDLGDTISSLPAVRQLGGGEYILCPHPHRAGGPREPMSLARANFLLPLLKAQSYITDARFEQHPDGITHDFTTIRFTTQKVDSIDSLADWNARHIGINSATLDTSPWLKAEPLKEFAGKVVFARSLRYNNHEFPWGRLIEKHRQRGIVFVGTQEEHHIMRNKSKGIMPWARCENALHMAQIIASCSLFVGNQSMPLWVALGLGVPFICSAWSPSPDVRLPRANGQYVFSKRDCPDFYRNL